MSETVTVEALKFLSMCHQFDPEATAWAAYDWLNATEAGLPYLALIEDTARQDARFWVETATPAELECYALAACDKLSGQTGHALFASRQIKRLSGALFRRMSPSEQAAFAKWINEQMTGKEPVIKQDQMTGTQE